MKMPWTGHSGLSKWIAICATVLMLSLGLCGINFAALTQTSMGKAEGSWLNVALVMTGVLEWIVIVLSLLGLVIAVPVHLVLTFRDSMRGGGGPQSLNLSHNENYSKDDR